MNIIGILGGTGEIGSRVIVLLHKVFTIKASYHQKIPNRMLESVQYYQVDIEKEQELRNFIENCNVVVNCAGASFLHSETVARIASEKETVYIDPFGANYLEKKLAMYCDKGIFVLSSGCFPGMTGILMNLLCETLEKVDELYGVSIDRQIPSLYGTIDFILSGIEGFGEAGYYYKNGTKIRDKVCEKIRDYENNELTVQRYYTTEIDRIVKKYKPDRAIWYTPALSDKITQMMQRAVWSYLDSKEVESLKKCAYQIRETVGKEPRTNRDCEISITAEGYVKDERRKRNIVLKASNSSNISAAVLSMAVRAVLAKKMEYGIYYAADIIDFRAMQSIIEKSKIKLYCNDDFFDNEIGVETYEEGYI